MPGKKKSKREEEEPVEEEPEEEPEEEEQEEEEPEPEPEPEAEDETSGLSAEEREAKRRKRRRAVARRRGYRLLATKGGYSASVASADAARDVAQNVVGVKEAIRACKWAPALPDKAAYGTFEEYAERLQLQNEPLPQGPAAVFRASGEIFLRKVFNESVQRAFDAGKTRVSVNHVMGALRPVQSALKFSFAAPTGLVRHAQVTTAGAEGKKKPVVASLEGDDLQIEKERKVIVPKQVKLHEALAKVKKAKIAAKAAKAAASAPAAKEIQKKKKKAAAA